MISDTLLWSLERSIATVIYTKFVEKSGKKEDLALYCTFKEEQKSDTKSQENGQADGLAKPRLYLRV